MNQLPAQPQNNVQKLLPFLLLAILLVIGTVSIAVMKNSQATRIATSTTQENTPTTAAIANLPTPAIQKELAITITKSPDNSALIINLDPQQEPFNNAISFSIDLLITPSLDAGTPIGNPEMINNKWSFPVTIAESKPSGTSIRIAGLNLKPQSYTQMTPIATIPLNSNTSLDGLNFTLLPPLSIAYDKSGTEYKLVLNNQ